MENCSPLLEAALKRAQKNLGHSFIHDEEIAARVLSVVNCPSNRAGARLLMSCMLAKVHDPKIDPRKPYTKIGSKDSFSGRTYDEPVSYTHLDVYKRQLSRRAPLPCRSRRGLRPAVKVR